jgi:hypothetical protein
MTTKQENTLQFFEIFSKLIDEPEEFDLKLMIELLDGKNPDDDYALIAIEELSIYAETKNHELTGD